jgi:uncharacterized membrane protein
MLGFTIGVYNTLKFLHVLSAVVWVGSGIFVQLQASRLRKLDLARLASFAKDLEFWGRRFFAPASLSTGVLGVALVLYSPVLGFSTTWIWLGLVGFGLTFITGAFFIGPTSGKLGKIVEVRPPDDPEVQAAITRILTISRIDQLVLVLVIADMVFKPGA